MITTCKVTAAVYLGVGGITLQKHVDAAAQFGHTYVPDVFDKSSNFICFHDVVSSTTSQTSSSSSAAAAAAKLCTLNVQYCNLVCFQDLATAWVKNKLTESTCTE